MTYDIYTGTHTPSGLHIEGIVWAHNPAGVLDLVDGWINLANLDTLDKITIRMYTSIGDVYRLYSEDEYSPLEEDFNPHLYFETKTIDIPIAITLEQIKYLDVKSFEWRFYVRHVS